MTTMDIDDNKLQKLFKDELPKAPKSKWFTRKVMNRLPPQEPKTSTPIENISYIIAGIAVAVIYFIFFRSIGASGEISILDIIIFLAIFASSIVVIWSYLGPKVRRWLNE